MAARFWSGQNALPALLAEAEADPAATAQAGAAARRRAAEQYRWDAVTDGYEALAGRLVLPPTGQRPRVRSTSRTELRQAAME